MRLFARATRAVFSIRAPRMATEAERCRNAVELLHSPSNAAVMDHLCEVRLMGIPLAGYAMDHFTIWSVMVKQVRRLAVQKKLDPAPKSAAELSSMAPCVDSMFSTRPSNKHKNWSPGR